MATALISGLSSKMDQGVSIRVAEPSEEARARLQSSFDVLVSASAAITSGMMPRAARGSFRVELKETLIYSEFPRYRDVPPFSMIVNH